MTNEQLLAVLDVLKLQRQGKRKFTNIFSDEDWGLANETLPEKVCNEPILQDLSIS